MPLNEAIGFAPRPPGAGEDVVALRVQGPAMEPEFRDGWLVYIDRFVAAEHGDFVVARPSGHIHAVLRQLVIDGDTRYLKAINPDHPEGLVALKDGAILGRVTYQARSY